MIVLHKNEMYSLEMPFQLFQGMKDSDPDYEVELLQLTQSSYKRKTKAKLQEVEDYSVARNRQALSPN